MVTMMMKLNRLSAEIGRLLLTRRHQGMGDGLFKFGGFFEVAVGDGQFMPAKNTACLEGLDALLSAWFNNGSNPSAFYLAPFTNGVNPAPSLTAANFAGTQGEYLGYTETTRQPWTPNGNSASQLMSNSNAPAVFTIGASGTTITGAALIATAGNKGATTGKIVAAALFPAAQPLGAGSTMKIKYSFGATPA